MNEFLRKLVMPREVPGGAEVTIAFEDIPAGVRPEDNGAGTRSSLEKLAGYVE